MWQVSSTADFAMILRMKRYTWLLISLVCLVPATPRMAGACWGACCQYPPSSFRVVGQVKHGFVITAKVASCTVTPSTPSHFNVALLTRAPVATSSRLKLWYPLAPIIAASLRESRGSQTRRVGDRA